LKKLTLIFLSSILISFVLNGCQQLASDEKPKEKQLNEKVKETQKALDVRETIWNQLSEEHKMHIQGTWEDASVIKRFLRESMGSNLDKTFIGKEVYIIDYPSNDNPTIGGIVVYADIKSHQLIGYGHRD
jgi:hypothetical protein